MAKLAPTPVRPAPKPAPRPAQAPHPPGKDIAVVRSEGLLREYEVGLVIDKLILDDELIEHPEKFYHVTEQQAFAMSYRDEAKSDIATAEAEADFRIRDNSDTKLTEPQIKALVTTSPQVRAAEQRYKEWKLLEKRWAGLLSSFESRQKSLEKLVNLYTSNYWSDRVGGSVRRDAGGRIADEVRRHGP